LKRKYSDPGTLTIIEGRMGAGKSDLALRMAEKSQEKNPDIKIITNVMMLEGVSKDLLRRRGIFFCNNWWGLILLLLTVHRSILILDEAGIFASSGYSGKGSDIGPWEQFIKQSRKFGVAIFWIDQRGEGSVPPTMRALTCYHYYKPQKFRYEMWEGFREMSGSKLINKRKLTHKDRTTIPFDTDANGSWSSNIPKIMEDGEEKEPSIRDLIDCVSDVNGSQIRPTMKGWVEKIQLNHAKMVQVLEREYTVGSPDNRPLTMKEVIRWLLDDWKKREKEERGPSAVADFMYRTPQSISRAMKEIKGETELSGIQKEMKDLDNIINDIDEVLAGVNL
jgi:hypothetical protein